MAETIVVTGGAGFVGRHVIHELEQAIPQATVVSWDRETGVDITQPESYRQQLQDLQPAWVIHLAALASVGASFKEPELVREVNVEGARKLLETMRAVSPKTYAIVASSADIYGQGSDVPMPELSLEEAHPENPYAQSKWEMEQMIEKEFLDRVIRVRPFPHIGPGQSLGFVTADFAAQIVAIERGKQPPVIKVGNLAAKRDFTDVRDVARAYRLLMQKGQMGEVYNIASGKAVAISTLLDMLIKQSKVSIAIEQDPTKLRPSDTPVLVGNASKLQQATGWTPAIPLEKTLKDILDYWREKS